MTTTSPSPSDFAPGPVAFRLYDGGSDRLLALARAKRLRPVDLCLLELGLGLCMDPGTGEITTRLSAIGETLGLSLSRTTASFKRLKDAGLAIRCATAKGREFILLNPEVISPDSDEVRWALLMRFEAAQRNGGLV